MNRKPRMANRVVSCMLCYLSLAPLTADATVATILVNGTVYTMDEARPVAEAIAIMDGVVVATGTTESITAEADDGTDVIDLKGQVVLPGFHDMHVHPLFAGLREFECQIPQGAELEEIQAFVAGCIERAEPGTWIYGGQWDASAIGGIPETKMLDEVSPHNPVLLYDTSGHSAWANSKALDIAGVDASTTDPDGGIIERYADDSPSGVLRESAIALVRSHLPPPTDEEIETALVSSLNLMLSYGITSYTEAAVGFAASAERHLKAYAGLRDRGVLKQRARLCITWSPKHEEAEASIGLRNTYARDRVSPDCVKIFLDGVPTDSHTAAMLEPYEGKIEGRDDKASLKGLLLVEQHALNDAVARFDRMGLAVKFHAAGDAAVRAGLDAIAAARKRNGFSSQLHDVGHCTFIARRDIARARDIAATFELSPYLWSPSPINDSITAAVGERRIKRVWPMREVIESGALVVPGSDWAVVRSVNPWIAIEALVTREKPGGSKSSFGKQQAVTVEQAIKLFTINSARHLGMEDKTGRIVPGMLADLIVLDQDPYHVPVTSLHETRVMKTMINGEWVYKR